MRLGRRHVGQMLAMAVASLLLGLGANFLAREPLPLLRPLPPTAAAAVPVGEVDADFVAQVREAPGTLLVDARAAAAYRSGHIPGALSLPLGEFDETYAALEPRLRRAGLLILYCSDPECGDSPELARRLWDKGLRNLLLFKGGMEEWTGRGLPIEK